MPTSTTAFTSMPTSTTASTSMPTSTTASTSTSTSTLTGGSKNIVVNGYYCDTSTQTQWCSESRSNCEGACQGTYKQAGVSQPTTSLKASGNVGTGIYNTC